MDNGMSLLWIAADPCLAMDLLRRLLLEGAELAVMGDTLE